MEAAKLDVCKPSKIREKPGSQLTTHLPRNPQFTTLGVPRNSPLRRTRSLFWTLRTNDEGIGLPDGFYDLMRRGKIELIAPARAVSIANDGQGVVLHDKRVIRATAIINATGHASTWDKILDREWKYHCGDCIVTALQRKR